MFLFCRGAPDIIQKLILSNWSYSVSRAFSRHFPNNYSYYFNLSLQEEINKRIVSVRLATAGHNG